MNLYNKSILSAFLATLFFTLFWPSIFPFLRISFFVPFIIILFYQKSLIFCLWYSLFIGLFLDLLSPTFRFGLNAGIFTACTFTLYHQKRNFFSDSLSTLPLMTFFFSALITFLKAVTLFSLGSNLPFGLRGLFSDIIIMPALDALFAFFFFILPFFLFGKPVKKGKDYFLHSKESN